MSADKPELDPEIDQREDGVVIEPGSEIDEDLQDKVPPASEGTGDPMYDGGASGAGSPT
jgi:hypothetical protein